MNSPYLFIRSNVLSQYNNLNTDYHFYTYIWPDSKGVLREKTRTEDSEITTLNSISQWNFDGSSLGLSDTNNSDLFLKPVDYFLDPFRITKKSNYIILCEVINMEEEPHSVNTRASCAKLLKEQSESKIWFGIEQEYSLLDDESSAFNLPLGWPKNGNLPPKGPYYCGVGNRKVFGRAVIEAHYRACLYAGLKVSGINAEATPSQWEYQIGPLEGIQAADQLLVSRYILERVAEDFNVSITFEPKFLNGDDWCGAGAHFNFSTKRMRQENGISEIFKAIKQLQLNHSAHIKGYDPSGGIDNAKRLTGKNYTCPISEFRSGVSDRSASVRIPGSVFKSKCGFLEDRRPASNCDPYIVSELLVRSCMLNEKMS